MKDVISHLIKPKVPYNPHVRRFSLVLSIKSKKAYKWVRQKFSNRLPALRTLRGWNANSKANDTTKCGYNTQTILTLKKLANEAKSNGKELYISLCFDEVAIRQHIQWLHSDKMYSGLINYGRREDDEIPVANCAIFFLVTMVESGCSLIFGYFLIKSLNTAEKKTLIQKTINEINSTGCYLMSIAFDGLATNFSACESLGASFDLNDFRPFFIDPSNSRRISIVLDPPHQTHPKLYCR